MYYVTIDVYNNILLEGNFNGGFHSDSIALVLADLDGSSKAHEAQVSPGGGGGSRQPRSPTYRSPQPAPQDGPQPSHPQNKTRLPKWVSQNKLALF